MNQKEKSSLKQMVPELRFPEFAHSGDWENTFLGKLCSITTGKLDANAMIPNGKYRFYTCAKDFYYINDFAFDTDALLISGNGANVGYIHHYKGKFNAYQRTYVLDKFSQDIIYIKYFLDSNLSKRISTEKKEGNTPYIVMAALTEMNVTLPSLPEQQKIADCLSSLDNVISLESQKLQSLQSYKKGLLQNLFPREGETVPKLRFPEFVGKGDWEERKLGEVYTFIVTNSLSRDQLNYSNGEFKNIHYGDIHTKFSTLFDITKEIVPYVNQGEAFNKIKTRTICEAGDIIIADASEDLADIGKSIEIVHLNNEKLISGLHTIHARPVKEKFVIGFGGYLFKSPKIRSQIQRIAQGAKVLGISASKLSLIPISFPSLPEQQKVADCLSSVDALIQEQSERVEGLKSHKKGLLQGLFPVMGE
ncbi:restriction endonuclease subunit S [Leptospira sp. 201903074]|uniref:restriction endonuclease subunit S n=1 Tax=Leptospira abararensis TaxID=2810036 RepID=UPI001964C32A|nr:restriction endonuclease subunit S [Leptospira abararensis]MBM9548052.1 restriction endonuclease subunit S [Leptospira abararensis]